jgi:hypothetical protein
MGTFNLLKNPASSYHDMPKLKSNLRRNCVSYSLNSTRNYNTILKVHKRENFLGSDFEI